MNAARWCFGLVLLSACEQPAQQAQPAADSIPAAPVASAGPASQSKPLPPEIQGAWSADGQNFTWLIEGDSILFEIDMLRHPFTMRGDTLLIDRGDPAIGIQRTRVVRVTADSMIIEDVGSGTVEALLRLR